MRGSRRTCFLRFADWERIRETLEDAEDLEAVRRLESDPNQDRIPLEVVKRPLNYENPLKVWREHPRLTQQALARAAGLPQSTIARLESGERKRHSRTDAQAGPCARNHA